MERITVSTTVQLSKVFTSPTASASISSAADKINEVKTKFSQHASRLSVCQNDAVKDFSHTVLYCTGNKLRLGLILYSKYLLLYRSGVNTRLTCGQVLLPASPLDVRMNDEQSVLTLAETCRVLLLKQLLHLAVIYKVFIIFLLLLGRCCVSTIAALVSVSHSPRRQNKRSDLQETLCLWPKARIHRGAGAMEDR